MANPRIVYNSINLDLPEPFEEIRGPGRIPDTTDVRTRGGVEVRHFGHAYEDIEVVIEGMSLDVPAVEAFADSFRAAWSWIMQGKVFDLMTDSADQVDRFVSTDPAPAGQKNIRLSSNTNIVIGAKYHIETGPWPSGGGPEREVVKVASIPGPHLVATDNLIYSYAVGATFRSRNYWRNCVALTSKEPLIERAWRVFDFVLPFRTFTELV